MVKVLIENTDHNINIFVDKSLIVGVYKIVPLGRYLLAFNACIITQNALNIHVIDTKTNELIESRTSIGNFEEFKQIEKELIAKYSKEV